MAENSLPCFDTGFQAFRAVLLNRTSFYTQAHTLVQKAFRYGDRFVVNGTDRSVWNGRGLQRLMREGSEKALMVSVREPLSQTGVPYP